MIANVAQLAPAQKRAKSLRRRPEEFPLPKRQKAHKRAAFHLKLIIEAAKRGEPDLDTLVEHALGRKNTLREAG